jgi:hypothetical protein
MNWLNSGMDSFPIKGIAGTGQSEGLSIIG